MAYRELGDAWTNLVSVVQPYTIECRSPSLPHSTDPELAGGWLAFECDVEKRRLWPVPPHWDACTHEQLLVRLAQAIPVGQAGTD